MIPINAGAALTTDVPRRSVAQSALRVRRENLGCKQYLLVAATLAGLLLCALAGANYALNPYLYSPSYKADVAAAFERGSNFAVFDLNFDMRALRREHIARMQSSPDVLVLGASHWQEGHAGLMPQVRFYNAHVHRDYVEDYLGMAELLVRHDRLPQTMIISIRDLTFSPAASRTDWWWQFFLPEYRAMAYRLGIEPLRWSETFSTAYMRELVSLKLLRTYLDRWLAADTKPGPTREVASDAMDLLLPDGSIRWSRQHRAMFTPEFAMADVAQTFKQRKNETLPVDSRAVEAMDRLLGFLRGQGVRVILAHPPFHPALYEQLAGTPYRENLPRVVATTRKLADKYGLSVVGSFDPHEVGCTASMFIDREHSNADCLQRIIDQVAATQESASLRRRESVLGLRGSL
jgi:hypothetical protein